MTSRFVVIGDWGLRFDEDGEDFRLVSTPDMVIGAAGACGDLRRWGETILAPETMPLAVVAGDEQGFLSIESLAMRVDAHRIHFWTPPGLPVTVRHDALARTLRDLFRSHHLAINNFECNHHPVPDPLQYVLFWSLEPSSSPTVLAGALLESVDDRKLPDLMLQPGNEAFRFAGPLVAMATLDRTAMLTVQRGGRRKKPSWDSSLWHVEQFRRTSDGVWKRGWTVETAANELRSFDAAPQVVAATLSEAPLFHVGSFDFVQQRVCLESYRTGALVQADIVHFRPAETGTTESTHCIFSLRLVSSRYSREIESHQADLDRIADLFGERLEWLRSRPSRTASEPLPTLLLPRDAKPKSLGELVSGLSGR